MERNSGGYFQKKTKTSPEKNEHMFSPQKIVHWKIFFGLWKQLALPFFEVGNMSSSFGGFNFHQVRSKKSVATAVSTRDSQGGVRHWLVETRGWETATGNGWRYQAGWNSEGWRLYVYIYICTVHGFMDCHGWMVEPVVLLFLRRQWVLRDTRSGNNLGHDWVFK